MTTKVFKSPCYKCAERTATCHAECAGYKHWLAEYREEARRRRPEAEFRQYRQERLSRYIKSIRKKRFEGGHT